jgi:hypothetical protein
MRHIVRGVMNKALQIRLNSTHGPELGLFIKGISSSSQALSSISTRKTRKNAARVIPRDWVVRAVRKPLIGIVIARQLFLITITMH